MEEQAILAELGAVMDQLSVLPSDAFAERLALLDRQAELREMLVQAQVDAGRDAEEMWAEQAARKQPDEDKPFIETHLPDSSASGG
jgi:spore germination cell wall hydrolase CwlJ-like protein